MEYSFRHGEPESDDEKLRLRIVRGETFVSLPEEHKKLHLDEKEYAQVSNKLICSGARLNSSEILEHEPEGSYVANNKYVIDEIK